MADGEDKELNEALDRLTAAENVDEQAEKEIRRYWNERVKKSKNPEKLKALRRAIARLIKSK